MKTVRLLAALTAVPLVGITMAADRYVDAAGHPVRFTTDAHHSRYQPSRASGIRPYTSRETYDCLALFVR